MDTEETAAHQEQSPAGQAGQNQKERKKRGAPKGHRGATRKPPKRAPDRTILVTPCQCPECHSGNVSACQETEEHVQEDLVIIRPIITRYVKRRGYCRDCGALFFPNGEGERPNGYLGPVAVAVAGFLRYVVKMPFESVRKIFAGLWGLEITPPAIVGFEKELAANGRPFYEQIADLIKTSLALNLDETSWLERDILKWLWTFVARQQVLFKIAASRSGDVIREVLGSAFNGVLGSDCFSAYNTIEAQAKQKCLAHYERAAKELEKFYPNDQAKIKTMLFTPNTS
jgi:transposase